MKLSKPQIVSFQNKILTWYARHQRDLPWRKSRDPYRILVSEIMLQQTQVNRVIPKYESWLQAFPTVHDLSIAPVSEVLKHWSGLGYNRRALNLKKTAQIVDEKYNREFPQNEKELLALPGIGQYTARAIMCFAFDQQVSVVDINVKKVILTQVINRHSGDERREDFRILRLSDSGPASQRGEQARMTDKEIAQIADQLVPHGKAYDWNQALMDYSSLMLKKEKIDIPKQSAFKGSRRYYRGQIVKQLLERKEISLKELGSLIKKDFTAIDQEWLNGLIEEMQREGFVELQKNKIVLAG